MKPGTSPPATTAHTSSNRSSNPRTNDIVALVGHFPGGPRTVACPGSPGDANRRSCGPAQFPAVTRELRHAGEHCAGRPADLPANVTLRHRRELLPEAMIRRARRQQKSDVEPAAVPGQGMLSGVAPRWVDVLFIGLVVYASTVAALMLSGLGGPPITNYVGLVSDLPAALVSIIMAAATARHTGRGALRRAWMALAAA